MIVSVKFFNLVFKFVSNQDYPVGSIELIFTYFFFGTELLRKTSEQVLIDMVQLLFARLPQFKDDTTSISSAKQVKDFSRRSLSTSSHQMINEQQINRRNFFDSFLLFINCLLFRNSSTDIRDKFNFCKSAAMNRENLWNNLHLSLANGRFRC